jgi:hypothetical protein
MRRVTLALYKSPTENISMTKNIAIFLCDITGVMAKPWVEAGYEVILVDPQHPEGISVEDKVTKIGHVIDHPSTWWYLGMTMKTGKVAFVMGFPPCTDVAVSGTKHFESKRKKDPHFQAKAALVAEQCRVVGSLSGAPWAFENPVSVFSSIFGKPQHTFHPYEFTEICMNDNYTKKTCLWAGSDFSMPATQIAAPVAKAIKWAKFKCKGKMPPLAKIRHLFIGRARDFMEEFYPDDRIHKAPPGAERANFRSATPEGFARAVFLANAPHLKAVANDNNEAKAAEVA